jgi:AhpD family alkylhydroperoxidase
MKSRGNPDVITAIQHLNKAIHAGAVHPLVLELVHLRASQINGCTPCVFAGVESAKKHGETEERLHNVVTWRETPFVTEEERAALALTEAATRIQDGAPGVTDEMISDQPASPRAARLILSDAPHRAVSKMA